MGAHLATAGEIRLKDTIVSPYLFSAFSLSRSLLPDSFLDECIEFKLFLNFFIVIAAAVVAFASVFPNAIHSS